MGGLAFFVVDDRAKFDFLGVFEQECIDCFRLVSSAYYRCEEDV